MWHAARKQEKMIRVMMVDYQKRAGRRREYYECIKQDPNQFLRVYGRSMKVHIDPALAAVADGPQIMQPWQGDSEVQIDRYDVRSHIEFIPPPVQNVKDDINPEESRCNYERYRILVQNDCAGVPEDQCLQQIYHDELFGAMDSSNKSEEDKKRKLSEKKAAIGFIYDDGSSGIRVPDFKKDMEEEPSDEEIDLDNILDIDMLTEDQEQVLNGLSVEYGMEGSDYSEFLQLDRDEMEALRAVKQIEEEKAQFSGRKSRRERRAFKERRLRNRRLSPPSYAAKTIAPKVQGYDQLKGSSSSRSRSRSPPGTGVIQFITSFGNNGGRRSSDEDKPIQGPSLPPSSHDLSRPVAGPKLLDKGRRRSKSPRRRSRTPRRRSRSPRRRSRSPRRRSRGRSRSSRRSRSRDWRRGRRSRSRSEGRSNGYRREYSRRSQRSLSRSASIASPRRRSLRSSSSSRSCSKSSRSYSRSRSRGSKGTCAQTPIKKYRRSSLSSKSGSEGEDRNEAGKTKKESVSSRSEQNRSIPGKGSVAASKTSTMTPQERLKRRMQMALTKQFKADKKAQIEKQTKEDQMKQDREEELRLLSAQMRQRDRERRHREREERDRLEAELDRPTRRRSRSRSARSRSRKRSRRSSSRGSRSRRSRSRESGSRRSRRRSSPITPRMNKPKLVEY